MCESGIQKRLAHLEGLNGLCPLRPWTTALRARFALPTGCATVSALRALLVFSKLKIQKLVAVGGGGQREALSTGGGWAVLQWRGWARPEPEGLSPPLWWGQRLCPCLERATGRGVGIPKKNGPFGPLGWCRGYSLCFRPSLNVTSSVIELMPFRTSASVPPSVISGPSKRTVSGLLVVFFSSRETTT